MNFLSRKRALNQFLHCVFIQNYKQSQIGFLIIPHVIGHQSLLLTLRIQDLKLTKEMSTNSLPVLTDKNTLVAYALKHQFSPEINFTFVY